MDDGGDLIFIGAEAEVRRSLFLELSTMRKRRSPKAYRRPELDERIRRERTKAEAQLLAEAQDAGVPVPHVLDIDVADAALELEAIEGEQLRVALEREDPRALELCQEFGRLVGRLHGAGLIHGDLTTSNLIVSDGRLVLLDFGLAQRSTEVEDRGVDLHLVERTFEASHPGRPQYLAGFVEGYRASMPEAESVLRRMDEIRSRGRYV